jgi:hypothetical protein
MCSPTIERPGETGCKTLAGRIWVSREEIPMSQQDLINSARETSRPSMPAIGSG